MNKFINFIKDIFSTILFIISILYVVLFVYNVSINLIPHINIENYPESIDYGILSDNQIDTFNNILHAAENEQSVINCPTYSDEEWYEILTQLGLYFGTMEEIGGLVYYGDNYAKLNLRTFQELEEQKIIIDARVDEAVSTLIEGSDKYKLWQICNYISKKITYTGDCRDTITALNGKGVCNSYAMLFYKMSTRLGIQSYICYGYAGNEPHAWNMVELNSEPIYFDITWYDNISYDARYVFKKSAWDRCFRINNVLLKEV